jgi:hypothetical protein
MSENSVGTNQPEEKKTGSNKLIIIIGIILIILLLRVIAVLLLRKPADSSVSNAPAAQASQAPKREVLVDENNVEELVSQMEEAAENHKRPTTYTASMNFEWHFASGDQGSYDSYVANTIENSNDMYFDIFLDGEEEAIYESPIIPIGKDIRNIRLNRDLDAGTYVSVLVYHVVDEDQNTLGTASFEVTLIVEN